jgi:hypothetical protein
MAKVTRGPTRTGRFDVTAGWYRAWFDDGPRIIGEGATLDEAWADLTRKTTPLPVPPPKK